MTKTETNIIIVVLLMISIILLWNNDTLEKSLANQYRFNGKLWTDYMSALATMTQEQRIYFLKITEPRHQ